MIDSTPRRRRGGPHDSHASTARQIGQEIQTHARRACRDELVTLTPLNGKKSFLFLSGGFEYQPGFVMAQYAERRRGLAGPRSRTSGRSPSASARWSRRANSDEITFYTVDALGLTGEGVQRRPTTTRSPTAPRSPFRPAPDRQAGCRRWPSRREGCALLNTNDFQRGLSKRLRGRLDLLHRRRQPGESRFDGKYEKVRVAR